MAYRELICYNAAVVKEIKMPTNTSYPIRLEKKVIESVRPIAKREGRSLKSQIEWLIKLAIRAEVKP